jgi:hypothetical protein
MCLRTKVIKLYTWYSCSIHLLNTNQDLQRGLFLLTNIATYLNRQLYKNVQPRTDHEGPEVEWMNRITFFLFLEQNGVYSQRHAMADVPPERPDSYCTVDWVGPREGLDG